MFVQSLDTTWQFLLRALITYFAVTLILRFTGRKSFTELDLFDFILAISFGDIFATIVMDEKVALLDGFLVVLFLSLLDIFINFLSNKFPFLRNAFTPDAVILYYKDDFRKENMKKNHITRRELDQALRQGGFGSYSNVEAVVLEPDGQFSVIEKLEDSSAFSKINIDEKS